MHPLALQLYTPPLVTSVPESSPKSSSAKGQSQSDLKVVVVEDEESTSSEQTVHEEPPVVEDFNKTFDDALNADIEAVIDGMIEMTSPDELSTPTPFIKVKKVATKMIASWLPKKSTYCVTYISF